MPLIPEQARYVRRQYAAQLRETGTLYGWVFLANEYSWLRDRLGVPEQPPRDFAVEDFGQLDWGGCDLGA